MHWCAKLMHAACVCILGMQSAGAFDLDNSGAGVCAIEDSAPSGSLALRPSDAMPVDSDCLIDVSGLKAMPGEAVLIDLRVASEIREVWIPGAASIAVATLGSNALVKSSKSVVLFGNGKDTRRLMRRCSELRQSGLTQVRVLDGGLPAWHRNGGRVAGNAASLDQPLLLDNRELHEVLSQAGGATVILASGQRDAALEVPGARIVATGAAMTSPKSALQRIPRAQMRAGAVVVFLPKDQRPTAWRKAVLSMGMAEPLFYVGDVSRYSEYLREQASIIARANEPRENACERG